MPLGLLVILGDINADLLTPHASAPKLLRKSLKLAGLSVPTIKPTRVSATTSTCLDLIGIPNELECIDYSVLINGTSDHYPIQAVLKACTDVKPCPVRKRSFKRVNMAELSRKVSAIALDPSNLCTADNLLESWQHSITNILDEVAPIRSFSACHKSCPWLTADVRGLMLRRDATARKIATAGSTPALVADYRLLKRKVKSRMRWSAREHGSSLLVENNSSKAWKFLREVTFTTSKGERTSMDLNILNEQLAKIVQHPHDDKLEPLTTCTNRDCFNLSSLNEVAVLRMLQTLKTKTATGPDGLSASLLKQLAPSVVVNITRIMNASITQCLFPNEWKSQCCGCL